MTATDTAVPADLPTAGRPGWLWPVRLIGSLIALLLIAGGAWSVVGSFFERTTTRTVTLPNHGVTHLVIDTDHGNIRIRAVEAGGDIVLTVRETRAFDRPRVTHEVVGATLMVKGRCPGGFTIDGSCATDLEVQVPEDVALELTSDHGDVDVDGVAGAVRANSQLGKVVLRHLRSREVEAGSEMGPVRTEFEEPPMSVRVRAETGAITILLPTDGVDYRVLAEGSGRARIEVPQSWNSTRVVLATAGLGSIRVLPTD